MKTQDSAKLLPIPVKLYSSTTLQRIEALENVINSHRALRAMEATLKAHDARRDAQREAIIQLCNERYANLCDALEAAEAAGAVMP